MKRLVCKLFFLSLNQKKASNPQASESRNLQYLNTFRIPKTFHRHFRNVAILGLLMSHIVSSFGVRVSLPWVGHPRYLEQFQTKTKPMIMIFLRFLCTSLSFFMNMSLLLFICGLFYLSVYLVFVNLVRTPHITPNKFFTPLISRTASFVTKKTLTNRRRTNHNAVVNARLATLSGPAGHRLGHTGHPTFKVKSTRSFTPPSSKRFDCDHTPRIRYCDVVQKCHHRDELQQEKGKYVLFAS